MKGPEDCASPVRRGLYAAAFVAVFGALTLLVFRPLHAQGHGQPFTGYLNGFDHLLQFPGLVTTRLLSLDRAPHTSSPAAGRPWSATS